MAKLFFILLILMSSTGGALAEGIEVSQSIDSTNIGYADSVKFEIVLRWDGSQVAYLFDRPLNPSFENLKVRRFASSIASSQSSGSEVTTKRFLYVLEPTLSGMGRIEPVTVSYLAWPDSIPGQLVTEAMSVNIAPPQEVEVAKRSYRWLWLVIVVGGGGVVAVVLVSVRRRRRRPVEVVKTPRECALDSLGDAKTASGSDLKKFQTEVYKILMVFLKRQYDVDLTGSVDESFQERLTQAGMEHGAAKKIYDWLSRAEKDKYSPIAAGPGEAVRLESEIREFFEKLRT